MPYQALFDFVFEHTLHYLVGTFVLLVAADHLGALAALVGGVGGEVIEYVEQCLGGEQLLQFSGYSLQPWQLGLLGTFVQPPGGPELQRCAYGTIEKVLPFGGEAEHVGHEEFRHAVLVAVVDVGGGIEPRDGRSHRCLGLAHHQRQAVHEHHHVGALGLAVTDAELVDQPEAVVGDMVEVYQAYWHVGVVLAEWH